MVYLRSVTNICNLLEFKQYVVSKQLAVLGNSHVVEIKWVLRNMIDKLRSKVVRRILNVNKRCIDVEENKNIFHEPRGLRASFEIANPNA